jgi:hypothetical protein
MAMAHHDMAPVSLLGVLLALNAESIQKKEEQRQNSKKRMLE